MPRTKVPPGSASKRSSSSASSWRAPNLSCCATSDTVRPSASRASFSSAPMPSLILALEERLVFRGGGETPAQLVRVALLGDALAELALDAQRKPERLGTGRGEFVVARNQFAPLADVALPIADV